MTKEEPREQYRVDYPAACRPTLVLKGREYEILDISEQGLKFEAAESDDFREGDPVAVTIRFRDGAVYDCTGEVRRRMENVVALRLVNPVSLEKIRAEQTYLIRNYPLLKEGRIDERTDDGD